MNTQTKLAEAHLLLFMLERKLWPDEEKTLEEALKIIRSYS